MGIPRYFAHTLAGAPESQWEPLHRHLREVSDLAGQFAAVFDSKGWGRLAGLWHDLGKYQDEFQRRLRGEPIAAEHSGAGAALAVEKFKGNAGALAFVIAGHHAGLANMTTSGSGFPSPLQDRLKENRIILDSIRSMIPAEIVEVNAPATPSFLNKMKDVGEQEKKRRTEFWTRFLFSCLVDADRLKTEAFCEGANAPARGHFASIPELAIKLDQYIQQKVDQLDVDKRNSMVNVARAEILAACRKSAQKSPGFFSLTVPTGGGKTLSGMSFALRHAEQQCLRRVIVVIPYTSIIEQNAQEYANAMGAENVIEHHSNLDPQKSREQKGEDVTTRHDWACENWDAPVIVTTTVQFFESLFSNRPGTCRKLHNIAESVIVLDEVQCLPAQFLLAILDGLKELVTHYGCSVVLSTATPPALEKRPSLPHGLSGVRPIIADPTLLAKRLSRVNYHWPTPDAPAVDWSALAAELVKHPRVLAIVHRRQDARELAQEVRSKVPDESLFHLSALMCPAHRSKMLADIRKKLHESGGACRVVSTQLVEAGVDLDFPAVYRALGGLDSIIQAAGRCNREGKLARGEVHLFRAPTPPPPGMPRAALGVTEGMLHGKGGTIDAEDPIIFDEYFQSLYFGAEKDAKSIQMHRSEFNFATVGHEFKLIEDGCTESVLVPYGECTQRLADLQARGPSRDRVRALQPFLVSVYANLFLNLQASRAIETVASLEGVYRLSTAFSHYYDPFFGLLSGETFQADPSFLIT